MPTIDFDGEALQVPDPNDLSVALTDWELLQVLADLPHTGSLPVALRGAPGNPAAALVMMPRITDLPAVVALARLRKAVTGPVSQEEAVDGAQLAQEPVPASDRDVRLGRLADDFQGVLERVLDKLEVDPVKHDHQNHAGDVTGALFAVLRRHGFLAAPEPVSVMDSPAGARSLRQATRDGYLTQRDTVEKFVSGALEGRPLSTERVMQALDEVLAR